MKIGWNWSLNTNLNYPVIRFGLGGTKDVILDCLVVAISLILEIASLFVHLEGSHSTALRMAKLFRFFRFSKLLHTLMNISVLYSMVRRLVFYLLLSSTNRVGQRLKNFKSGFEYLF